MSSRQRIVEQNNKQQYFFINNSSIKHLFLKRPIDLLDNEIKSIKDYYNLFTKDQLLEQLSQNQILPFGAHAFSHLNLDKDFWNNLHKESELRAFKILDSLNSIFQESVNYGCNSLTLTENFATVLLSGSCLGCFSSGDVDLSADIQEKDQIISLMKAFGYKNTSTASKIGEYSGQSCQFYNQDELNGSGFWINVIWLPVTRAFFLQDKFNERLIYQRLQAETLPNYSIRILNQESLLYFSALHISAGHYYVLTPGFRLYVDLDRIIRNHKIDFNTILKWESDDDAGIRISMPIYLCFKILGTPISTELKKRIEDNSNALNLINYIINLNTFVIRNKSNFLQRLLIELLSSGKNPIFHFPSWALGIIHQIIKAK